jgi:hypothetical protein
MENNYFSTYATTGSEPNSNSNSENSTKKVISIDPNLANLELLTSQLPSEAAMLLASMQNLIPKSTEAKINISDTSPDLSGIINASLLNQQPEQPTSMVRAVPEYFKEAHEKQQILEQFRKETNHLKKLTIYEVGIAMGIIVGKTKRDEVIEIMKSFSKFNLNSFEPFYFYNDLSVTIFFDENDDTVCELKFGNSYQGATSKGLFIGDPVEKALLMYGQPRMKSDRGAIWEKFAIFCERNMITSIRLQK